MTRANASPRFKTPLTSAFIDLTDAAACDLLEIVEARHKRGSTIFSSQFNPAGWHMKIDEDTLADAFLGRVIHDSYTIPIDGQDSMQKRKGIAGES